MAHQLVSSKKGEIDFRKKLVQQQVEGKSVLSDEYSEEGIREVLKERMKNTFERMDSLKRQGVVLSPYLEIGAERCQRSLVMENDFQANGAACDISYDMLKSCDHYSKAFDKKKIPMRICCDANSLPFRSNSMPFVFSYETLHHFPDPAPIVKEIHRVLSPDGYFFFDEEPYRQIAHINLYRAKNLYSQEKLQASKLKRRLDLFLAERTCNEVRHGIIENDQISIPAWKRALSVFDEKDVQLQALGRITAKLFEQTHRIRYSLAYLLGGKISGLCHKKGIRGATTVREALACPSCRENGRESSLVQGEIGFVCTNCGNRFPVLDGVVFLFAPKSLEELYPEVFQMVAKNVQ